MALLGSTSTAYDQTQNWASGWLPLASAKTTPAHCACGTPAVSQRRASASWKQALRPTQRSLSTSWAWTGSTQVRAWTKLVAGQGTGWGCSGLYLKVVWSIQLNACCFYTTCLPKVLPFSLYSSHLKKTRLRLETPRSRSSNLLFIAR